MTAQIMVGPPPAIEIGSEPRPLDNRHPKPGKPGKLSRNLAGPTLLVMSLGVLLMAAIANAGRAGSTGTLLDAGWIAGLIVIYAPAALRIVGRGTPVIERVLVAIGLGLILQFSRLVLNPTTFAFHDELIHANTLRQIDQTGRLFTYNPLLPVSAYYPGLEVVTDAVQRLTGLSAFTAATVTLMAARLIMVLAIIGLIRVITGSYRAGAVGVLVYVANPQLLFFNSQFSYQTLALPLALLSIYLFAVRRRERRFNLVLPLATVAATIFTHHLTGALLVVALAVWLVLTSVAGKRVRIDESPTVHARRTRIARIDRRALGLMSGSGAILLVASVFNPGNPITAYLAAIGDSSSAQLLGLTEGQTPKALFSDSAGAGPAPWEQVLLVAAVLIATAALLIVLGYLRTSWRGARPLALLIGLIALLYPVIPAGHLTQATAEVGDRAAGFVFIGTAAVLGAWWWQRQRSRLVQLAFALGCTAVFLGNVVLGAGPTAEQLPGPFEISADARSIDADNIAAANWEKVALAHDSVVYADRTSGLLAAAIGGQDTVLHVSTGVDASRLLLAPTVTGEDVALISQLKLDYLIVDTRLSTGLPHQQVYIENGEYGQAGRTKPVSATALDKFATISGVERIYDNGSFKIYNVRGLR
jgi:hypothetical protein